MNEGDWDGARVCLKDKGCNVLTNDKTGHKTLGMMLMLKPPLEILKQFVNAYPHALSETDGQGRFPLHVACHIGSGADTIKFLLKQYPDAILMADGCGMYPLHHAIEAACEGRLRSSSKKGKVPSAVALVAESAPTVIDFPDDEDRSPLDIALMASTSEVGGLFAFLKETSKRSKENPEEWKRKLRRHSISQRVSSFESLSTTSSEEEDKGKLSKEMASPNANTRGLARQHSTKKQFLRRSSADRATVVPLVNSSKNEVDSVESSTSGGSKSASSVKFRTLLPDTPSANRRMSAAA